MSFVIAIMAMFIAFVTLWFVRNSIDKLEGQNHNLLKHVRTDLVKILNEVDGKIDHLETRIRKIERAENDLIDSNSSLLQMITDLRADHVNLETSHTKLDRNIPIRYRYQDH